MTPPAAGRVRILSSHAGYRCRNSGVCCSSGWDIPVEPGSEARIEAALRSGTLRARRPGEAAPLRPVGFLPHGARVVLRTGAACVFLEGSRGDHRCAIQGRVGEDALPSACRHFPRVVTLTPLGASITLSHYCPTAAATVFGDDPLGVVENPPAFPPSWPYEGLDAREALPPLLRPGVLMDWPCLDRWERFAVSVLAEDGRTPEAALDVLEGAAEAARRWRPEDGPFGAFFEGVLGGGFDEGSDEEVGSQRRPAFQGALREWRLVAETVPHRASLPAAPEGLDDVDSRWVAPAWPALARPVRRWLSAKAFASWIVLQGEGLRTTVAFLRLAIGVLRAEAARGSAAANRAMDADLLREAVRRADLLLVQLADPEALARRLSRCEVQAGSSQPAW